MNDEQIVCLGAGSEYALAPLAAEARRRGLPVLEIDMYRPGWRTERLGEIRRPFILVTSHHPYVDSRAHLLGFGEPADLDTVGDFVYRERPKRCYYIPHDLADHLHPEELHSLHLFDALLMPNEVHWFLREWVRVEQIGWIGSAAAAAVQGAAPSTIAFLPSEIPYYSRFPALFADRFSTVLSRAPTFKLPQYPGSGPLEIIALNAGCTIVAATVPSNAVIGAASAIVSNGLSSIVVEAVSAGKPTLCIVDGVHPAAEQRAAFAHIRGVTLAAPDEVEAWLDLTASGELRPSLRINVSPIDFDRAFELILGSSTQI